MENFRSRAAVRSHLTREKNKLFEGRIGRRGARRGGGEGSRRRSEETGSKQRRDKKRKRREEGEREKDRGSSTIGRVKMTSPIISVT